jgi:hypothetical protein
MTRARKTSVSEQFDLFLPYIADLPLRDQREMMERPFFPRQDQTCQANRLHQP